MYEILLVVYLVVALALVGMVLIQLLHLAPVLRAQFLAHQVQVTS